MHRRCDLDGVASSGLALGSNARHSLTMRMARSADRAAILAMVARCSTHSLRQRFGGAVATLPTRYLARVLRPPNGDLHLIAFSSRERVIALASLADRELALLVEDDWQTSGIGTVMLRALLTFAGESRQGFVTADIGYGNHRLVKTLRTLQPRQIYIQPDGWRVELDPQTSLRVLGKRWPTAFDQRQPFAAASVATSCERCAAWPHRSSIG